MSQRFLLDTSVFVALESGRPLGEISGDAAVSVITLGELHAGVLAAAEVGDRAQRLRTLSYAEANYEAIPVDHNVAREWGRIVINARERGRRAPVNDAWIAATAAVHELVVVTQDGDYDAFDVPVYRV